jgi:hypothetical protein
MKQLILTLLCLPWHINPYFRHSSRPGNKLMKKG